MGFNSQWRTGVLRTSWPCRLAIWSVLKTERGLEWDSSNNNWFWWRRVQGRVKLIERGCKWQIVHNVFTYKIVFISNSELISRKKTFFFELFPKDWNTSHITIGTMVVPQLVYCLSSKCRRRLLLMHLTTWHLYTGLPEIYLENFEKLIWAHVKGFVAEINTTFRLKDVKELVYGRFGRITKEVCCDNWHYLKR
jgi:hypothetical protein